jgi:hypothetical protein
MTQFWRGRVLAMMLAAVAALMACSGPATAAVTFLDIQSPTAANPAYVQPGSTVEISGSILSGTGGWIELDVVVGTVPTLIYDAVLVQAGNPSSYTITVPVPAVEGTWGVTITQAKDSDGSYGPVGSPAAVITDGTAPTVNAVTPTAPIRTTNPTPTWAWSVTETGSGLDHYIITLDGQAPIIIANTAVTSFTPSSFLTDGPHILKVEAVDRAGNVGVHTFEEVYVDTAPPEAPVIQPLAAGYRTPSITLNWSAVTDGPNTVTYEAQWDYLPTFSSTSKIDMLDLTSNALSLLTAPEGEQWFRVRTVSTVAPDEEKRSAWSLPVSTIYDTTAPAAPVLSLVSPDPTNAVPQVWTWTSPPDAVGYKVSIDGGTWADVGDVNFYHTGFATEGDHSFAILAYDWLGNESSSVWATVTIDTTPPARPVAFGLDGVSPTNDNTPAWWWTHDPATEAEESAGYELLLDGVTIIDVGWSDRYVIPVALSDGLHSMQIRAYDNLGNRPDWLDPLLDPFAVWVVIDTTPPPVPEMPTAATPTNYPTPEWTWPAIVDAAQYNIYLDGTLAGTLVADPMSTPSYTPTSDLTHGQHLLEVSAVDLAGNESARSTPGHVIIDLHQPTAPVFDPMPRFVKREDLRFSWSVASDELEVTYTFYFGAIPDDSSYPPVSETVSGLTGQSRLIDTLGSDAEYQVSAWVKAIDAAGNESEWFIAPLVYTDDTVPTVAFTDWPTGTINNPRPTWIWEGNDAHSGISHYIVKLDDEPSFITTDTLWTPASDLADGVHTLRVMAVDVVGNESELVDSESVTIDTTPPQVPGIPIPEETPTNNTTPAWTWQPSEGAAWYNVYLDDELIANVTDPQFTAEDYELFEVEPLTEGRHNLQVTAVDEAENESDMSGTGHVLVDLTPPEIPELDPLPEFTNAQAIRFVWTAVDGAVSYDLEDIVDGRKIPAYTLDISARVTGDVITTRVRAYDSVGNVSEWSDEVSTTVDRTGPTTTEVTAPPPTTNNTRPTWEWIGDDAGLSGVSHYIVTLDGEAPFTTTGTSFTPAHDLPAGNHTLTVQGVDVLGNVGNLLELSTTVVVEPVIIDVNPVPGTYAIDRISTLMLYITGMIDAPLEVAIGSYELDTWRIVELYRTPTDAKYYLLLDEAVLVPGRLVLTVRAGMTQRTFIYEVLNERSGFGFGRLRPW